MRLQRQLGNGNWIDTKGQDQIDRIIQAVLDQEPRLAVFEDRSPMTTRQEVLDHLASGQSIRYADKWYMNVRDADAIKPRQHKSAEMVKCSCGHTVAKALVMSASLGTSCPSCYDRMSN